MPKINRVKGADEPASGGGATITVPRPGAALCSIAEVEMTSARCSG